MELLNSGNAYKYCLDILKKKGYTWKHILPINLGRYHVVIGEPNIFILFKRDIFYSFGIIKELKEQGAEGVGETINLEHLKIAVGYEIKKIYFVYERGAVYSIDFWDFMKKSIKWKTKAEGKDVRSISLKELTRVNPDEKKKDNS